MYRAKRHKEKHPQNNHNNSEQHPSTSRIGSIFRRRVTSSSTTMSSATSSIPKSFTEATTTASDGSEDTNGELPIALPLLSIDRVLAQSAMNSDLSSIKSQSRLILDSQDLRRMYTQAENLEALENGGVLFSFACQHALTPYEAEMVDCTINLSGFEDEEKENYVHHFEYEDYQRQLEQHERHDVDRTSSSSLPQSSLPRYTFLLTRCGYLLTGFDLQKLLDNPLIIASLEYQKSCQPDGTRIWDDVDKMDASTFRMTKPIIPYIFNFTIQFCVSRVEDKDELQRLSRHLHVPVHGAIVLERTKRSVPPKQDATRKIKSVLAYTDMGSGVVLVSHLTVMLQVGLPEIIERILGTIGQWGLGETAETAWRTRKYLQAQLPYTSVPNEQAFFLDAASEIENQVTISDPDASSDDDDDDFFDAVDDAAQDLSSGMANLAVH